jgi:hypothetical protein
MGAASVIAAMVNTNPLSMHLLILDIFSSFVWVPDHRLHISFKNACSRRRQMIELKKKTEILYLTTGSRPSRCFLTSWAKPVFKVGRRSGRALGGAVVTPQSGFACEKRSPITRVPASRHSSPKGRYPPYPRIGISNRWNRWTKGMV